MKLKFFFALLASIGLVGNISAQNIVSNQSFEEYSDCPMFYGEIDNAIDWFSCRITPDYFNSCANSTQALGVPINSLGHQYALSGNAYAGLITYSSADAEIREYLGTQLIQPLVVGTKYYFSVFISRADTLSYDGASNNFGFRFSTEQYTSANPVPVDNFSHYHSDSIVTDKNNWIKISGSFIADSTYTYLVLGNFYSDANTDTADCIGYAYYYVDGICTTTDSMYNEHWTSIDDLNKPNVSVFPNPVSENLFINAITPWQRVVLIDVLGNVVFAVNRQSYQTIIDVSNLTSGFYTLILTTNKTQIKKKISIIH